MAELLGGGRRGRRAIGSCLIVGRRSLMRLIMGILLLLGLGRRLLISILLLRGRLLVCVCGLLVIALLGRSMTGVSRLLRWIIVGLVLLLRRSAVATRVIA